MMNSRFPKPIELIIAIYCIWQSGIPLQMWYSPFFNRTYWPFFLIWLLPVVIFWIKYPKLPNEKERTTTLFFGFAILLTLLGELASFNALHSCSAAIAVAGLIPFYWQSFIWLGLSISWMVAFRYALSKVVPDYIFLTQLITAVIATTSHFLLVPYWQWRNRYE